MAWIIWNKVLATKKYGGLGVSSFYALNRALLFKWSLEATSEFSVKYVRQLIDDSILPKKEVATRWVKVMPIKINVFAWRVCLDKLPTRLNLSLEGIDISTIVSPLCHASVESGSHNFFSCSMARHLWRKLVRWWELDDIDLASYDD
ncbi:RNA-directed DNA polymerase, eukaryota [Tanacetum coccineum]